jgi:hypothetical protein
MRMKNKIKLIVVNAIVFVFVLFILESITIRNLTNIPLGLHHYLSKEQQILAQNSKKSVFPENYIMIVGDSYAQGLGDWLMDLRSTGGDYYSGDIIAKKMRQDLITLGEGGLGNVVGIGMKPSLHMNTFQDSSIITFDNPEKILIYFYEGNDLNNNLEELKLITNDSESTIEELTTYMKEINKHGWNLYHECSDYFLKLKSLPFLTMACNILRKELFKNAFSNEGALHGTYSDENMVVINGVETAVPDKLQGPAMELTDKETSKSLKILNASLITLQDRFPRAEVYFVYIPSPLSIYTLKSEEISTEVYLIDRKKAYSKIDIVNRHNKVKKRVLKIAEELKFNIIDTTKELQLLSNNKLIHGPKDWFHLNRHGQEELGDIISREIKNE